MGGMGDMMKQMGVPPKKDFYPSLVEIPTLTDQQWNEVQQNAHKRMSEGLSQLSIGLGSLSAAVDADNFSRMQDSLAEMRQGIKMVESGVSAHRLLAEGEPPKRLALNWLKSEMNLAQVSTEQERSFFGLSAFHFFVMFILIVFSVSMIIMYFVKMRRAAALLERLTSEGVGVKPPPSGGSNNGGGGDEGGGSPSGGTPPVSDSGPSTPSTSASPAAKPQAKTKNVWSGKLKVSKITKESPSIKTFRLVNPAGGSFTFPFLPGQFVTLSALIDGKKVTRSYTIASSPTETEFCDLSIKREDQGVFSRYLHDQIKKDDLLDAKGPGGVFVFTGSEASSIVLIAAGVGVTPFLSIIRYLTAKAWDGNISLLFSCRAPEDYIFRQELEELEKKFKNLKLFVSMTRYSGSDWSGLRGRFTKEMIHSSVPDINSSRIHICGPVPFMDGTKALLSELNVKKEQIKIESFGSARKSEPIAPLGREEKQSIVNTSTTVEFSLSGIKAALPPSLTVLEAAESVDVEIDNSCRAGTCGLCKVQLVSGQVEMEVEDALEEEEKKLGLILACQAKAKESLVVEA